MKIILISRGESKADRTLSVKYERQVSVEWFLQSPGWYL